MNHWTANILLSEKDGRYYIGSTCDVERSLKKHNAGGVDATKHRRPLKVVYFEQYANKKAASARERYLKSIKSMSLSQP